MSEENYDPYDLSEGTVLGEGIVSIQTASFGYDAQYGNGEVALLILEGSVEADDGESHEWRKLYSIGKGWDIADHGARVSREDGRKKNFQKQSKYGLWLAGALESGAGDVLRKRGTPMEAKIWDGLTFEVRAKETDYGGEIGKKSTLVPVKFLGESGSASAPTASAAPSASATAQKPAATPAASGTVSPALKAKLKKLALECESHDNFIDRAFVEVEGVDGDKHVEGLVADSPEFYETLRAG